MTNSLNDTHSLDSTRQCRICLSEDEDKEVLIFPCSCKGSIKYVHPSCLTSWRKALVRHGRGRDADRCTLCKRQLNIRARGWVSFLANHKLTPVVMTALVLFLILIPAGYIMKGLVVMSIRFTDRYENSSNMVWDKPFDINADVVSSKSYPLYAPFPVCSPSSIEATSHALFTSPIVYWMLFPFSDDRCWHFILCKLQHFHLGFFLLGSVNNVWFTYKILGDMFDIILGDTAEEGGVRLTRGAQLIKTGLLIYTSILVCIFWIHFNLFAFRAEATEMGTAAFRLKNFLAELPLWGLRWVTLSVAVGEFAVRSLYQWLGKALYRVEDNEILSIDEDQTAETSPSPWRRRVITTSM